MKKNTSTTGVYSPVKVNRSASEDAKIKKLYDEQANNYKMGYELYGISEKINPIDPIPAEMKNFEVDYEISEVMNGKPCVLGDSIFRRRVPPITNMDEIRKLSIVKKGLMKAEVFRSMLRTIDTFRRPSDCFNIFCEDLTEEQVSELHKGLQILTDMEKNLFVFETSATNGKRVLRVMVHKGRLTNDEMRKWGWEKEYVHFTLRKKNTPFKKPLGVITDVLRIKTSDVGFAQLKDAGPISLQRISVPKPYIDKLIQLTRKSDKFQIGSFEVQTEPIKIGDLDGNRYRIALRSVSANIKDQVNDYEECLEFLKHNGFINYFGNKRFLNKKGVPVYQIGKALLTRNYEEAISLIMTPSRDDPSDVRAMKERWALSDGSPSKTLQGSESLKNEYEYKLVQQLEQNPDDLNAALEKVPLNIRLAYIFAYQSYMWNIIASQRIKRKGLKLFPGDIVLASPDKEIPPEFYEDFSIPLMSRSEILPELQRDPKKKPNYKDLIKFVTQEDIDEEKYTIRDLLLPLPGSEVFFPRNNDVGIWYTDFLSKDGLNKTRLSDKYCINGNEIVQNLNYFLHGTYRKLIVIPKSFKWEFKTYKKLNENLIDKGKSDIAEDKDRIALVLEFTLPGDSYVNMALREIVDLEKSGFNDIYEANKKAVEEEKLEQERLDRERKREREAREKARLEKEKSEREKKAALVKERLDVGVRKERLDGGVSKERLKSTDRRSREVSQQSSTHRARSKELLDGGIRKSRSTSRRSPDQPFNRLGPREVSRGSNSQIEVRVGNDRVRSRSRSNDRYFNQSRFPERFPRPDNRQSSFDGIPICEFNTLPEDPDMDESFQNTPKDNIHRMTGEFRLNDAGIRVWDSPPRERPPTFEPVSEERRPMPFEPIERRQSVFAGRLEPRTMLRNPDPPEMLEPGRLLEPSPFFRKSDDLRHRLADGSYDPEREFDRFEREVQELNRGLRSEQDIRREQEIRLREALERDDQMRLVHDERDFPVRNDRRRAIDGPLSPETAQKLRRLDEEALRLDLKRVTRLQNFDADSSRRDDMDFGRDHIPERTRRDFDGNERNLSMSRDREMAQSRVLDELERNFLIDREKQVKYNTDRAPTGQVRGVTDDLMDTRFDDRTNRSGNDDISRRFMEVNTSFGRERQERRSPSPSPQKRQNVDRFEQKSLEMRPNNAFNTQNDRFGNEFSDQRMEGNKNNFGPSNSSSFSDLRNNLSRNNQQLPQFGQGLNSMPLQPGPFQNINQRQFPSGNNNNNNFGQNSNQGPNQFRGNAPWNNMNRLNSPPKQQFSMQQQFPQQDQWMNQDPNYGMSGPSGGGGPQGGPMMPNQFNNPMFGGNNNSGGHGMAQFPNNQQQMNPPMMNFNNMYQNQPNPMIGQGMMGFNNPNNNMQRGGPNMLGNNMQGPMQGGMMDNNRPSVAPPGYVLPRHQNNRRSGKSRFN